METQTVRRSPVVFTNKAECRDCYRCLRVCPVKAIRMDNGQASVDPDRCIACGTCITSCPQGAKQYRRDLEQAINLLGSGQKVALSLAPSFAAFYQDWQRHRLPSAFRKLGFSWVAETAVGAFFTAAASRQQQRPDRPSICTACPTVVNLIEKYHPGLVDNLLPVPSPMLAHASIIHERLGDGCRVIFVGPCIAKKKEADRSEGRQKVDLALTFEELESWLERENIQLDRLEDSDFDEIPVGESRIFPLPGGLARTAGCGSDILSADVITITGVDGIKSMLEFLNSTGRKCLIEPMFCSNGCVNGPAAPATGSLQSREKLIDYSLKNPGTPCKSTTAAIQAEYSAIPVNSATEISEEQIKKILAATGKFSPADQLNCGACGYDSCRDKAIAVIRGLAETQMCIPYMRRMAEQRTDRIIETSPNGIVMLNEKLCIISMNPAFRKMFLCSEAVLGRHISYLVDPQPFEKVLTGSSRLVEETVNHARYNLVAHQIVYQLEAEKQLVGIFVNITMGRKSQEELDRLKSGMIHQAREMLEHQMQMAQELARHLGESTAQGEIIIENLLKLASADEKSEEDRRKNPWDTFTSK
ncbi:MAG: [Fe-Fe] hydrogenase large subunit C-terminal domain-containing protein [Candidatus Rifleibacteriota bacterium]